MRVKLLAHTPDAERIVAAAAKLCYSASGVTDIKEKLTDEQIERFLNMLIEIGHESPVEHITFTFGIEGISRACSHQIVRHRISSFSQQSQRYVKLEQFEYIIPPQIEKNEKAKERFIKSMEESQKSYNDLFDMLFYEKYEERKDSMIKRCGHNWEYIDNETKTRMINRIANEVEKETIEDCRYVFPNACATKMVVTMNARSLLNFFNQRCCERAQWEIRVLANDMLKLVQAVAPIIFKNAGAPCKRGECKEGVMSCRNN